MHLDRLIRPILPICIAATLMSCHSGSDDPQPQPTPTPPGSGLDQRPSNLTCVAPPRVTGNSTLSVQRAFPALTFLEPVAMLQAPGDSSRWFVVEQNGIVRVFANQQNVRRARSSSTSARAYTKTARPRPACSGSRSIRVSRPVNRAYVNYSSRSPMLRSTTSEFTSPDGGLTLNPNSERILLSVNKPFDNHNGGQLGIRARSMDSCISGSATAAAATTRATTGRTRSGCSARCCGST